MFEFYNPFGPGVVTAGAVLELNIYNFKFEEMGYNNVKSSSTSSEEQKLININEAACKFFTKYLFSTKGSIALNYLRDRGLSIDTIKEFRLGLSPSKSGGLINSIVSEGYNEQDIENAGLAFKPENKPLVDRFRNRVMFPISNLNDRVVAFGGRSLNTTYGAKYINSPETKIFKKGSLLFNLRKAKKSSKNDPLVIVEGYMDVVSLFSNGIKNVIANSGTALTERQINLIWRYFENPIICLDGDISGRKAALRAAERLFPLINEENKIYFSILSQGKDPDDIIKDEGKEGFLKFLDNKTIIQSFIWDTYVEKINTSNPYEITKFEKLVNEISNISNKKTKTIISADHGLVNINAENRHHLNYSDDLQIYGDQRSVYVNGSKESVLEAFSKIPGVLLEQHELSCLLGEPTNEFLKSIYPDFCFLVEDKNIVYPKHLSAKLKGYHGGISEEELKIPIIEFSNF